MHNEKPFDFETNVARDLSNAQLRQNLRSAMDTLISKRQAVFPDEEEIENLREIGNAIKQKALNRLPELLDQLEKKCMQNGIQVYWAETTDEANQIVLDIMRSHDAKEIVKGKSMVSEEMHINHFLIENGIEPIETDLGEFIIQLAGETPSHIIVPAIHKNKDEVAQLFHEKIPDTPYTEKVEELTAIARNTLRKKYAAAQVGLSGVNFAIAETGTLLLVENEGNGRMCTTVPPVHIAVMGLEKVIPNWADVPPLLRLLTGSATGQLITTYVNMITTPRKPGQKDGPKEVHLIILDNGRSHILADPEFRQTLQCIRCGTCLNHCPVYTRIGGHAYGFVYPGPIGKILTPQIEGLEKAGELVTASSLCNACGDVCPVKIPIPSLIRRLRNESHSSAATSHVKDHGSKHNPIEHLVWKAWVRMNTVPLLREANDKIMGAVGNKMPSVGPLRAWKSARTAPKFAKKSLHQLAREKGVRNE
jgi:L-lactate dehydrogenase complex protein LldF